MLSKKNFINSEIDQLYKLFRITYGIAFIGSGADKFCNFLINWHKQDLPYFQEIGSSYFSILHIRGAIEVVIGIALFTHWVRPSAYSAAFWLILSAIYMMFVPGNFDSAMRYAVVALGAYALARLSVIKSNL